MGGVPGTGRQRHQEHPIPRDGALGGTGQRRVEPPHPPGMRSSAWLPLQEAHAGTSQQEWLGSPKSLGVGAAGSRGGKQAATAPGPRQALPSSPEGSQAARDSCELSRSRDPLIHREAPREGPVLERDGRPVPTAVKHRGAGPARCGRPAGLSQGPRGASICWAVWQGGGQARRGWGSARGRQGSGQETHQAGWGWESSGKARGAGGVHGGRSEGRLAVRSFEGRGSFQDGPSSSIFCVRAPRHISLG